MKHGITALLLIGLLAIPISCIFAICPMDHDCCPKTASNLSTCPYDILSSATGAAQSFAVVPNAAVLPSPASPILYHSPISVASFVPHSGDLNILNRVLLI
jgi:hypothetical protein